MIDRGNVSLGGISAVIQNERSLPRRAVCVCVSHYQRGVILKAREVWMDGEVCVCVQKWPSPSRQQKSEARVDQGVSSRYEHLCKLSRLWKRQTKTLGWVLISRHLTIQLRFRGLRCDNTIDASLFFYTDFLFSHCVTIWYF